MRTSFVNRAAIAVVLIAGACSSTSASKSPETIAASKTTVTTKPVVRTVAEQRPFAITVRHETFVDASRSTAEPNDPAYSPKRSLPTDLYIPTASGPLPLIMFSHGYHGDPSKFSELFTAWAHAGYIVAAPQFPLTSTRGKPYDILTDYVNQPGDISFVLNAMLNGPMKSKIDAERIAAAGLSLGGATTIGLVYNPCCRDTRLRSAAIFDAVRLPFAKPFEQNAVPVLFAHIDTDIAAPYEILRKAYVDSASPKWLLTFQTGVHPEAYENTPSPHDATAIATSIDFFDLTLLGDEAAKARLLQHGTNDGESSIVAG